MKSILNRALLATAMTMTPYSAWARSVMSSHSRPRTNSVILANHAATLDPVADRFVSAVQVYPWSDGMVFKLFTSPGKISDIVLEPGETMVAVASGDTVRWIVGNTTSGAGLEKQVHILVKPTVIGLSTNLVITTDRRSYHIELISTARTAMEAVRWLYPQSALITLQSQRDEPPASTASNQAAGIDVEHLSFAYKISGDSPQWRPVRVFDDGRQSFVEFPLSLGTGEAPPLFVIDAKGNPSLVNYRVRGHFYVVDRLFEKAELRLGDKPQKIVRIEHDGVRGATS